jgi:23S rRNA pseudouridine2605 synthase
VTVNGSRAALGQRVSAGDRVVLDGRTVQVGPRETAPRVILYHKPSGEIVSRNDPQGRPTVFERIPEARDPRWIAIGRLDFNTSGLLLLTDSGDLAHRFMHPSFGLTREYAVRILGALSPEQKRRLLEGVTLEDGPAHFDLLEEGGGEGSNRWYRVILQEGRNREVRRLFQAVGLTVSRLIRVAFGPIHLPRNLRQGRYVELDEDTVRTLLQDDRPRPSAPAGGRQ